MKIILILIGCILCLPLIFYGAVILIGGLVAWWGFMIDGIKESIEELRSRKK